MALRPGPCEVCKTLGNDPQVMTYWLIIYKFHDHQESRILCAYHRGMYKELGFELREGEWLDSLLEDFNEFV